MRRLTRGARLGAGVIAFALSFSLVLRAHLGLGPWHVLQEGVAHHLGITLGQGGWVTGAVLLVLALAVGERPGLGTAVIVFLGGIAIDLVLPLVGTPHGTVARFLFLGVGTILMGLSGAFVISADVGMSPLDALMTGIAHRSGRRLYGVRVGLEVAGLLAGWAAGGEVGLGSVVVGLGIGPSIQWWLRRIGAVPARLEPSVS